VEDKSKLGLVDMQRMNIAELKPAGYNPRVMTDKAREGLSNSIDTFGLVQPIIWNKRTGVIVGGHQRLYDLTRKGVEETDVIVVDLPEVKEKALNVALNYTGITGDWDNEKLQAILEEMEDEEKMSLLLNELEVPDFNFEDEETPPENPGLKPYEIKVVVTNHALYDDVLTSIRGMIEGTWPDEGITVNV